MTAAPPPAQTARDRARPARPAADDQPEDAPRPKPDETITLTCIGIGATWTVHSSKAEHRIECRTKDTARQVTEYPWDDWVGAARFVVSVVNREYVTAGRAPSDAPVYCGDCGAKATRGPDGAASCPVHGKS